MLTGDYRTLIAEVPKDYKGTLRDFLMNEMELSGRLIKHAKQERAIFVDSKFRTVRYELKGGERIRIRIDEKSELPAEAMELNIAYEDEDVLVLDKEPGRVVHPTHQHLEGTLLNGIRHYALSKGEDYKPHVVNRLDRDTSGLMIVAKNSYAHFELMKQMDEDEIIKKYQALVWGQLNPSKGLIDLPIIDRSDVPLKRVVGEEGRPSRTEYEVLGSYGDFSLVELHLLTGRTHQIRVHLSHLGHPIVGDSLYGSEEEPLLPRQALHSCSLEFTSPRKGRVKIKSSLPRDMMGFMLDSK